MEADGLFVHQQRSDASLIPGIHTNGKLCFWNESPTLTAYLYRSSPGSAGVSPASLFLQQPPSHGHSLAKCTKPAFTGFSSIVPSFVRAGRPRSRGVLCGRDARAPGGAFDRLHCLHRPDQRRLSATNGAEIVAVYRSRYGADGLFAPTTGTHRSSGITNGKLCFWNESPTLTAYLYRSSPGSAGVSPASLFLQTASQPLPLPRKVHQTRLYGVLFNRAKFCAGGTPAFPGGLVRAGRPRSRGGPFDRLHCLHRLIREGCQRNERCEKSLQCTSSAMEADGLFVHQQRSDASLIPGIHTNGKLCFWNELPTLTAYLGRSSPGSAGVSPASLFLQTASQPLPLPRKVHQTRLYGVLFPRARLCAGGTPALPGGLVRARRPRSRGGFYADLSRSGAAGPGVGAAWGRPGPWRTGWVAG